GRSLREEIDAGSEYPTHRKILHAIVRAGRGIIAVALEIRFEYFPAPVELELVTVENIIEQHDFLPEADREVHRHGHRRDDQLAPVDLADELAQREMAQVERAALFRKLQVLFVFLFAAEEKGEVARLPELAGEENP